VSDSVAVPQMTGDGERRVVFCIPIVNRPFDACVRSLEASLPLIEAAGWTHGYVQILNMPYISAARANMLRAAMDAKADVVVFIDYDVSWDDPRDLLRLIETEGDVVAGTYRCKIDEEFYMGKPVTDAAGYPIVREDGAIKAELVPAGFLKVTKEAVGAFMTAYPHLCYGPKYHPCVDLFNHGAEDGIWWGEDYAFSRRWRAKCGDIWIVPNLGLDHNTKDTVYRGNYHEFLLRQAGGSKSDNPIPPEAR
jgi:glycosyltransferase involved in cell wall biosynthesis